MRRFTIFGLLFAVLVAFGLASNALAQQNSHLRPSYRTYTGSISASNAAVTSLIPASDELVIHSMQIASTQSGALTFTDGSGGVALLVVYVVANTPLTLTVDSIGPAGIHCTRGNELYVNALASATVYLSFSTTLE